MAEIVEESYVKLGVGKPTVMRFDKYAWQKRAVIDPDLGFAKDVKALVFHVVELEGRPVSTIFSLISDKAQKEFVPYLAGDKFRRYRFTIIKEGAGFVPPRIMMATPI